MSEGHNQRLAILVVEDSDEDFTVLALTFRACGLNNEVLRVSEGAAVLPLLERHLRDRGELPGLIILDLNIIGMDGREVLRQLKSHPAYRKIPVVVFSTSSSPRDVDGSYAGGAACYAVKPVRLEKLEAFVSALKTFWIDQVILPRRSEYVRDTLV